MPCCGSGRKAWITSGASLPAVSAHGVQRTSVAYFQYIGDRALTVVGPVTGRRYHFGERGVILAVEPADRRGLAAVPLLRMVREP